MGTDSGLHKAVDSVAGDFLSFPGVHEFFSILCRRLPVSK